MLAKHVFANTYNLPSLSPSFVKSFNVDGKMVASRVSNLILSSAELRLAFVARISKVED
jgi:hypothetical protein